MNIDSYVDEASEPIISALVQLQEFVRRIHIFDIASCS